MMYHLKSVANRTVAFSSYCCCGLSSWKRCSSPCVLRNRQRQNTTLKATTEHASAAKRIIGLYVPESMTSPTSPRMCMDGSYSPPFCLHSRWKPNQGGSMSSWKNNILMKMWIIALTQGISEVTRDRESMFYLGGSCKRMCWPYSILDGQYTVLLPGI